VLCELEVLLLAAWLSALLLSAGPPVAIKFVRATLRIEGTSLAVGTAVAALPDCARGSGAILRGSGEKLACVWLLSACAAVLLLLLLPTRPSVEIKFVEATLRIVGTSLTVGTAAAAVLALLALAELVLLNI
jgi:hypothetical protein